MPNRRVHRRIGAAVGGTLAFALSHREEPTDQLLETLGGALGGWLGGALPDWIDPPTSPRHRSIGHGVFPVGVGATSLFSMLGDVQGGMRALGDGHRRNGESSTSMPERLCHSLLALLTRLGAGAFAGLLAGYLSHVSMDAFTPAGLPLFD